MSPGRGLPSYQVASWSIQPFGHNRHGPKIEGLCPFGEGGAGSASNTMWPGPRPTSVPSFILIHPTVWPQYTNVTDSRTDNGPIAQGKPFYKRSPKNWMSLNLSGLIFNEEWYSRLSWSRFYGTPALVALVALREGRCCCQSSVYWSFQWISLVGRYFKHSKSVTVGSPASRPALIEVYARTSLKSLKKSWLT